MLPASAMGPPKPKVPRRRKYPARALRVEGAVASSEVALNGVASISAAVRAYGFRAAMIRSSGWPSTSCSGKYTKCVRGSTDTVCA